MDIQKVDVAYLNTDPMTRMICQEKECQFVAPVSALFVWRIWQQSKSEWVYVPFCHNHVLTCLPVSALPKG